MYSLLKKTGKWFVLFVLIVIVNEARAQTGTGIILKKVLDGSKSELVKDAVITIQDSAYFSATLKDKLDTPYYVRNVVTFRINEYSNVFLANSFSATANVRIVYTKPDLTKDSVETILDISYDTASTYNMRNSFVFNNAHEVTVRVLEMTTSVGGITPVLILENEMQVKPVYKISCVDDAIRTISADNTPNTDSTDEIRVSWPVTIGADEYDLEWTYIDSSALSNPRYGNPVNPKLIFRDNASRVTVTNNEYKIPLLYDNGGVLYFRVRAVQDKRKNSRLETAWSSDYSGGMGSYAFSGHQRKLNWQSSVSFAEEGKRKVVVQYYDGSLRNRQTVSKDNSTNTTLVSESFYDHQGRPVIQVLPAPTLNTIIKYNKGVNTGLNSAEYDKDQYDNETTPAELLSASAKEMSVNSGANQYYSPNNPDKNTGFNAFIPDAQGYAFTETEYMPDNTGRISRQSGVGPVYKLGSNHETKYYYSTPKQEELDALFGTEVGLDFHYFKNMVRDANGQYAVSYLDMHGRTIATALAGTPDSASLDNLPSNIVVSVTDTLSGQGKNIVKDLVIESSHSQLVALEGTYEFKYSLTPPVLKKKDCEDNIICYNGLYDLQIRITDDVYNQHLGGKPFDTIVHNFSPAAITASCDAPQPFDVAFSIYLPKGNYSIIKQLTINKQAWDYYKNEVFLKENHCKTMEQFIQQQSALKLNEPCFPTCSGCLDSVGTWNYFRDNYLTRAGIPLSDSTMYRGQVWPAYEAALDACGALCNTLSKANDVKKAMLLDMTAPSGQYATVADSLSVYSIFYKPNENAVAPYSRDTVTYLNELGQPDLVYDESTNSYVIPQKLTKEQFASKFKTSWANALLKFHPEYCKLLKLEQYSPSSKWDVDFETTDSYAAAKLKGYLNPTANTASPFSTFPAVNANQDPLSKVSVLKSQLESKLNSFKGGYSLWSIATITVKCESNDNACTDSYNTPAAAFNESKLCAGDLDMAWRNFRGLYLSIKEDIINEQVKNASCTGGNPTVDQIIQAGKHPHFNSAVDALNQNGLGYLNNANIGEAAAKDSSNKAFAKSYEDNCKAYVNLWIQQLSPCKYSQTALDQIIPKLIQVCKEGADVDHPNGASTIKPGSSYSYNSFQAVLNEYNVQHGITNPLECNSELITAPAPYDRQPGYSNKPSYTGPDDCECGNLKKLQDEYLFNKKNVDSTLSAYLFRTRKVNIPQVDLNQLIDLCNSTGQTNCTYLSRPVVIPTLIQCGVGPVCADCDQVNTIYSQFKNMYPGIIPVLTETDSVQLQKNSLFANYMNNRLGFSKQPWEYLTFLDSCGNYSAKDSTVCTERGTIYTYTSNGIDKIVDVQRTSDNGYILAGSTTANSNGGKDGYIIKTNRKGEFLWSKTFGAAADDNFDKIRQTTDGGYIAIGTTKSFNYPAGEAFIVKTDASGNVSWSRVIGFGTADGENGCDIIQTSDKGYAIAGRYNIGINGSDWIVAKLKETGKVDWVKRLGTYVNDDGISLLEHNDTLVLSAVANLANFNGMLIKVNKTTGALLTAKSYSIDDNKHSWFGNIFKTSFGYRISSVNTINYRFDNAMASVIDIFGDGALKDARRLSPIAGNSVGGLTVYTLSNGGMLTAQTPLNSPKDIWLHGIATNNVVEWSNKIKLAGDQDAFRILQHPDGAIAVAGIHNNQAMLMLTSALGKSGCIDSAGDFTYDPINAVMTERELAFNEFLTLGNDSISIEARNNLPIVNILCSYGADSCHIVNNSPLLCGSAEPVFSPVDVNAINNCTDHEFFAVSTGTALYNVYLDSLLGSFDKDYISTCLEAEHLEKFTMKHDLSEYHYTLYYYDQAGNLVKTVPPAGVVVNRNRGWLDQVMAARTNGTSLVPAHGKLTHYRYNTLNQVVAQQTPDAGQSHFWYDRLGRMVVSQNALQAATKAYSYTLYDELGRVTEVGQLTSNTVMTNNISRKASDLLQWLNNVASTREQITRTVYDLPYAPLGPVMSAVNLRNRVSWTAVYNTANDLMDANKFSAGSFYSYDIHGNVDTLIQDFKLGAMADAGNRFKKLVYKYDLISGKVNHVAYQPGQKDAFYHRYSYDAENRITNVQTSQDSVYWENDAFYQYYQYGPLARMVLGQQQVQGQDYAYTLQGRLKGVNSTSLTPEFDMGKDGRSGSITSKDAFGFALHYFGNRDYIPINGTNKPFAEGGDAGILFKPLFNGNIAAMSVNLPLLGTPLLYTYGYDVTNRLANMNASQNLNTSTNTWVPTLLPDFKESVSYDADGNILTYKRNGNNTFSGKPIEMDNLTYTYKPGTNKLDYVSDQVPATNYGNDIDAQLAGNYNYDAIGNMVKDNAEGITDIKWTVYGKIKAISKSNGTTINYTYDAAGNRISKDVSGRETWYVRDAIGNVMSIYTKGNNALNEGQLTVKESHLYGSSRLGLSERNTNVEEQVVPVLVNMPGLGTATSAVFVRGNKAFELSNHLGNVLATVSDKKIPVSENGILIDHYVADVTSSQDYYPFGMLMPGRNGYKLSDGWSTGSSVVNGHSVPEWLSLNSRTGNQPGEYVASEGIDLKEGFSSGVNDLFDAYLADGTYTGGGSGSGTNGNTHGGYRYGFNGKEIDSEVAGDGNQYDYGFRIYNPRIGRFLSTDPLIKSYPWYTPYQFAGNKPIAAIDIDGAEEFVKTSWYDVNGKIYKTELEYNINAMPLSENAIHAVHRYMDKNYFNYSTRTDYESLDGLDFRFSKMGYNKERGGGDYEVVEANNPFLDTKKPGLFWQFYNGTGSENTVIHGGKMIEDIKNMKSFKELRGRGLVAMNADSKIEPGEFYSDYHAMNYWEGFSEIWVPGLFNFKGDPNGAHSSTQHFLGSYALSMQVLDDGETILYTLADKKSLESFTDHQMKGNSVDRGSGKPLGTTYQRYIWTEKIDKKEVFGATHYYNSNKKIISDEKK